MSLAASSCLLELTHRYHLLPFVFLFLFVGVASILQMAAKFLFQVLAEIVRAFYDFKGQCAANKQRYLRTIGKD